MSISTINESQRKAARVAGLAYLITFATLVSVNFGIFDPLIVENNARETARNILAHEQLFRIGIAGNYGTVAHYEWLKTPEIRKNVELDVFQIMPNS